MPRETSSGACETKNSTQYKVRTVVTFRVPKKTQFKQPAEKADLIVRWREHTLNLPLDDGKFQMDIPVGLPSC